MLVDTNAAMPTPTRAGKSKLYISLCMQPAVKRSNIIILTYLSSVRAYPENIIISREVYFMHHQNLQVIDIV
jgi:hypothetical protein